MAQPESPAFHRMPRGMGLIPPGCPLAEIHLHFEGSIPPRVIRTLARRGSTGRPAAESTVQRRRGFGDFLRTFVRSVQLLRDAHDVEMAASALFEDLRREGIRYAEVTFSPQAHLLRGMPLTALISALAASRAKAAASGGPRISYVADGGRLWGGAWLEELADQLADFRAEGVVALGLGGDETVLPAKRFRRAFERAAAAGLHRVAHAGEGTTARAVREVLDELNPERIGHGIAAARDPALLEHLARRGTTLEICPTSNLKTGAVTSLRSHPLARIVDAGVRVAIGSDDRTIFGTTLRGEIRVAVGKCGLPRERVPDLLTNAIRGSFAPAAVKRGLLRDLRTSFAARRRRDQK